MAELTIRPEEIRDALARFVQEYEPEGAAREEIGTVIECGDGIARVEGLPSAMASELLVFENGVRGLALNLDVREIGVVILGEFNEIEEGQQVKRTGEILSVPVGDGFLGRVVGSLGEPLDGKGPIESHELRPLETQAPSVVERQPVTLPMPLIEITPQSHDVVLDIAYATAANFTGKPVYAPRRVLSSSRRAAAVRKGGRAGRSAGPAVQDLRCLPPERSAMGVVEFTRPIRIFSPIRGAVRRIRAVRHRSDADRQRRHDSTWEPAFDAFTPLSHHAATAIPVPASATAFCLLGLMRPRAGISTATNGGIISSSTPGATRSWPTPICRAPMMAGA